MRLLATLPANTGIHYLEISVQKDQLLQLCRDTTAVERRFSSWTPLLFEGGEPGFCQVKSLASASDVSLTFAIIADTLLGPANHGCSASSESELGIGRDFQVKLPLSPRGTRDSFAKLELGTIRIVPRARYGSEQPVTAVIDVGNSRTTVAILDTNHDQVNLRRHFSLVPLGRFGTSLGNLTDSWFELSFPFWPSDIWVPSTASAHAPKAQNSSPLYLEHSYSDPAFEHWRLFQDPSRARLGRRRSHKSALPSASRTPTIDMSSPKRYIWSTGARTVFWFAVNHQTTPPRSEYLRGSILHYLLPPNERGQRPFLAANPPRPNFSRSQMATIFIVEILTQVFHSLNSLEFRRSRGDEYCRYLNRIVLTFPAAMPMQEVRLYQDRVQAAIDALYDLTLSRYSFRKPSLVTDSFDEASASQLTFVYSKVRKGPQQWRDWLSDVAPDARDGTLALGCLDIGGGSIDASIIGYHLTSEGVLLNVDANLTYLDGVSKGGDDLLLEIIERILIPSLAQQLGIAAESLHSFFRRGNVRPEAEEKPLFARQILHDFLFPLAIRYIRIAEGIEPPASFQVAGISGVLINLLDEIQQSLERDLPALTGKIGDALIPFDRTYSDLLVGECLGVIEVLARRLTEEGIQALLLTGRLSVLDSIRELAVRGSGLCEKAVFQIHNSADLRYFVGISPPHLDWILDPKLSVVYGAAIAEIASQQLSTEGVAFRIRREGIAQRGFHWGRVTPTTRNFVAGEPLLFSPGTASLDGTEDVVQRHVDGRMLLGRKLSSDSEAEANPVYELSMNACVGTIDAAIERVLGPNDEEELELKVKGRGSKRAARGLELRLKTQYEDEYWLDSGLRIL